MPTLRKITTVKIPTATPSAAGTASVSSTHAVVGRLLGVYVKYAASSAAGTDVTIATAGNVGWANTLLTLTDKNTSGWYYPRQQFHDATGTGVTYDGSNEIYEQVPIADIVNVSVAQATESKTVDVTLLMETF